MHIGIITPAAPKSLNGNRATAQRWADFLIELGHQVTISVQWDGADIDVMLALHAWRSADSIAHFKQAHPTLPLIVAMTGTDLYHFINTHSQPTLASIEMADKLITLHRLAEQVLPQAARKKVQVIHQSALPLTVPIKRSETHFDICVVGHLREEKDALRVAYAVRNLPESSRIRVLHYGKAHNAEWAEYATAEMSINPRYHWYGEVSHDDIRTVYASCHLMVLPSIMEGGANVISEATVAGLPVIASEIDGSVGLLGDDYVGYYPVKNEAALRDVLLKAENDKNFMTKLSQQCHERAKLFSVDKERQVLGELMGALN